MITTISGPNTYLRLDELNRAVAAFIKTNGDLAVERLDGGEVGFEQLRGAMQSLPFLSPRKLVVLNTPSLQKQFYEQISELLESINDSTDIIIVEPKLDKRSSYYKILKKETAFKEFTDLSVGELTSWAVSYATTEKGMLTASDANLLINRVGVSQELLRNEIDKLLLYDPKISARNIELLTEETPQSSIFELLDAALSGDLEGTERLYHEQRALKIEPLQIIAMLAWQLHLLAIVKTAENRSAETIASEAGVSPFALRKCFGLARTISFEQLKIMISDALNLDLRLKSESLDPDEALQYYLLTIRN